MIEESIAGIATAPGEAGIGIVRISGARALECARALFRRGKDSGEQLPPEPRSHRVYYGRVVRAGTGERLDECVLTYFAAPHSYTGEDVVELACHGSNLVLVQLLGEILRQGVRLAEPGEFTRRAFLNGRMDLTEAESVIDIIRARTDASLRVASGQHSGRLAREIGSLRRTLIGLLAEIEAAIDFPDDVEPPPDAELERRAREVRARVMDLLSTAHAGKLYREGASLVLAGRPNVGKSSLLNALLGEDRAIVADLPGTTRDVIEESFHLRGIPVRAADTAGFHETLDTVEALGVERTRRQIASADLVVWVLEAPAGITARDLALLPLLQLHLREGRIVVAANKVDLGQAIAPGTLRAELGREAPLVPVSATTGQGLEALESALAEVLLGGDVQPEAVWVSNVRHESRLRTAAAALEAAIEASAAGFDQAAVTLDLRLAADALGEITGETVVEETITEIFARFCVGK